ncbi:hypothetical protein BU14_0982s0006 [Porphyra umbilicalis]|uniref:Uncharacterized protein n=1 Tax=Porphyra umbilicalis TaxID=2786 RepID=A0A1X6NMT5_PORUM|nr:hypothetical protein BU14_0982s0006 [Porphyra umbilicalis]|eukprot:OSX69959.1 hypothetical protein BU14_0982s0006 [Porphyra umbilicalis]
MATERLPTEAEAAEAEARRLQKLEALRLKRMNIDGGDADTFLSTDEEGDDSDGGGGGGGGRVTPVDGRHRGGDDLDDGGDGGWASGTASDSDDGDGGDGDAAVLADATRRAGAATAAAGDDAVPYAFASCPASAAELAALFRGRTAAQRATVLGRLRVCFAPALDADNRRRLDGLLRTVLARLDGLAAAATAAAAAVAAAGDGGGGGAGAKASPADALAAAATEMDHLLPQVHALGALHPPTVIAWARARVLGAYEALLAACDAAGAVGGAAAMGAAGGGPTGGRHGGGGGGGGGLASAWTAGDLLALRAVARLFPGSDAGHAVTSPLAVLLNGALTWAPLVGAADLAVATYAAGVAAELASAANRYSGEAVRFAVAVVTAAGGGGGGGHPYTAPSALPPPVGELRRQLLAAADDGVPAGGGGGDGDAAAAGADAPPALPALTLPMTVPAAADAATDAPVFLACAAAAVELLAGFGYGGALPAVDVALAPAAAAAGALGAAIRGLPPGPPPPPPPWWPSAPAPPPSPPT